MAYDLKSFYNSVDELTTRDRSLAIMYGRVPSTLGGGLVPINVDAAGNLQIGTEITLNVSEITPVNVVQPSSALLNATVVQPTAALLNATAVQPTASLLNATVTGTVAATQSGTWSVTSTPVTDLAPATQNITTQDLATTATTGANGQNIYTGTPTAGSVASYVTGTKSTVSVQATGTWTGTLQIESSMDGGTTWSTNGGHQKGVAFNGSSFAGNFECTTSIAGCTNFRVRAITAITGTAVVTVLESVNTGAVYLINSPQLLDGSGTSTKATVLAASIVPTAANTALVVAISPNSTPLFAADVNPGALTITTQDLVSVTTAGFDGQSIVTGTPTVGSVALFTLSSVAAVRIQVTGVWTGTLSVEGSIDGSTTWNSVTLHIPSLNSTSTTFTANVLGVTLTSGYTALRVRATAAITGTATITVSETQHDAGTFIVGSINKSGSIMNTGQVTVANTATLIIAANSNRKRLVLVNTGNTTMFFGGSTVTAATGQMFLGTPGYPLPIYFTGAVYGITASGTSVISYQEEA